MILSDDKNIIRKISPNGGILHISLWDDTGEGNDAYFKITDIYVEDLQSGENRYYKYRISNDGTIEDLDFSLIDILLNYHKEDGGLFMRFEWRLYNVLSVVKLTDTVVAIYCKQLEGNKQHDFCIKYISYNNTNNRYYIHSDNHIRSEQANMPYGSEVDTLAKHTLVKRRDDNSVQLFYASNFSDDILNKILDDDNHIYFRDIVIENNGDLKIYEPSHPRKDFSAAYISGDVIEFKDYFNTAKISLKYDLSTHTATELK